MMSVLLGLVATALGFCGAWVWRVEFVDVLKGLLPVSLFFAGLFAVIAGLSSLSKHGKK